MYLDRLVPGFCAELEKIAKEITPESREHMKKSTFAQPNKEEEGHKGKYPIPDKKHFAIAKGFAKMHHDPKALAAIERKGEEKGYTDDKEKEAGLKNWLAGAGLAASVAGGGHALAHQAAKPVANVAQKVVKAPMMMGGAGNAARGELAQYLK